MNWMKALLIVVLAGFALVFLVVAAVGLAATAAVTTAAVAVSESGVVQAFEEVAEGAERLQIDVDDNSITFTDPDSGESRVVTVDEHIGRGRVEVNVPEVKVTVPEVPKVDVSVPEVKVTVPEVPKVDVSVPEVKVTVPEVPKVDVSTPEITITDPDSGQSRVIRPNTDYRAPRVVWDGEYYYGPELGLRIVGGIFRGLFSLTALVLIAAGAFLLLRNRRQAQSKADQVDVEKSG